MRGRSLLHLLHLRHLGSGWMLHLRLGLGLCLWRGLQLHLRLQLGLRTQWDFWRLHGVFRLWLLCARGGSCNRRSQCRISRLQDKLGPAIS